MIELDRPVLQAPARVLARVVRAGPLSIPRPAWPAPAAPAPWPPRPARCHRRSPGCRGQPNRPGAHYLPVGLRQLPGRQRRHHGRVRGHPPGPRRMPGRGAPADPGLVDQPRPRAVRRVRAVPLARGERRQHRRARRGGHRRAGSSAIRACACVSAASAVGSAAASQPSPARTISSASLAEAARQYPCGSPPFAGTDGMPGSRSFPGVLRRPRAGTTTPLWRTRGLCVPGLPVRCRCGGRSLPRTGAGRRRSRCGLSR